MNNNKWSTYFKNNKWSNYFKTITLETAKLSTCVSKNVGAILVRDRRILCSGYNGTPPGKIHCYEIFNKEEVQREFHHPHHDWSVKNEIHAEIALLGSGLKYGINTHGATLYVSLSPCIHCAKALVAAGVKDVFYIEKYERDMSGLNFLKNNDVSITQI
jgi:dCMP deaminase